MFRSTKPAKLQRLRRRKWVGHRHADLYERTITSGPDRLVMTVRRNAIDLIIRLTDRMEPPFGVLYVLVTARSEREPGRYQNAESWTREQLVAFLSQFRSVFECDGRHALWIASLADSNPGGVGWSASQIVYDQHDMLYAYGELDAFEAVAQEHGLRVGRPAVPSPHAHCFYAEFDDDVERILSEFEWIHTPLIEEVDDP